MRYMFLISSVPAPPPPKLMEEIARLGEARTKDGSLVTQGGLMPLSLGARVRVSRGQLKVHDGPFTESKEVIGGYAIFECASKEEALEHAVRFMELHRQHWPDFEGECEMRLIMG
jgi:hypothetical protein